MIQRLIKQIAESCRRNVSLKIGSVLLAAVLWILIQSEKEIEAFIRVAVQLVNRPNDLLVTNSVPDSILVTVRGAQSKVKWLQDNPLPPFEVNLFGAEPGSAVYKVFPVDFKIPGGVQITKIKPQIIQLRLEKQRRKNLPVQINFVGNLESGFSVEKAFVEPAYVTLAGTESELNGLGYVLTSEVSLNGIRKSFSAEYPLAVRNDGSLFAQDLTVKVVVEIKEDNVTGTLADVPVQVQGGGDRFRIEPSTISVVVAGPAGKVNDLIYNKPLAYVESRLLNSRESGRVFRVTPVLDLPPDCQIVRMLPRQVFVRALR